MNQTNPLSKHFRQPAIYLKLPSQGKYWEEGSIELPATGELPVFPMTTRDEITLRTPDALMNGSGVVSVIQSCIPNILDPWKMPSIDVDACLVAIRIASYGNDMDINSKCPACSTTNDHTLELTGILDNISMPNYDDLIEYKGLKIKLKPQNYFAVNRVNNIRFKEEKILENLTKTDISAEEREINIRQLTEEMIDLNFVSLANSTEFVLTSEGNFVTDVDFIKEFYANAESALIREIQEHMAMVASTAGVKPYDTECTNCGQQYKTTIEFDYSNFFAQGS